MKLPLLQGDIQSAPRGAGYYRCPVCKRKISVKNGNLTFHGGAIVDPRRLKPGNRNKSLGGFLSISRDGTVKGVHNDYVHVRVDVAREVDAGQWEMSFCSEKCFFGFLKNVLVALDLRFRREATRLYKRRHIEDRGKR